MFFIQDKSESSSSVSTFTKSQSPDNFTLSARTVSISAQGNGPPSHSTAGRKVVPPAGKSGLAKWNNDTGTTPSATVPSTCPSLRPPTSGPSRKRRVSTRNLTSKLSRSSFADFDARHLMVNTRATAVLPPKLLKINAARAIIQKQIPIAFGEGRDRSLTKMNALV